MPPGTLHAVMTLRDSISVGTSLYMPQAYLRSLETIISLHHLGLRLTNADYPDAHLILFHLIGYYWRVLKSDGFVPPVSAKERWDVQKRRMMLMGFHGQDLYKGVDGKDLPAKDIYAILRQGEYRKKTIGNSNPCRRRGSGYRKPGSSLPRSNLLQ